MNRLHCLTAVALGLGTLGAAHADVFEYTGDTSTGLFFHRPLDARVLSGIATRVRFQALDFSVSRNGAYSFVVSSPSFDSYSVLYEGAFDPVNSLTNVLDANDDLAGPSVSGLLANLRQDRQYTFVTSGFTNDSAGPYTLTITSRGAIMPVPEPETYAMMLAGLCLVCTAGRRAWRTAAPAI